MYLSGDLCKKEFGEGDLSTWCSGSNGISIRNLTIRVDNSDVKYPLKLDDVCDDCIKKIIGYIESIKQ